MALDPNKFTRKTGEALQAAQSLARERNHAQVTPEQQTAILTDAGLDEGLVGFIVGTDASIQRGDLSLTSGDLSALIGRPTTPIAETLRTVA